MVLLSSPSKLFLSCNRLLIYDTLVIISSSSSTGAIIRSATSGEPAITATTTAIITAKITSSITSTFTAAWTFSLASLRNTTVRACHICGKFLSAFVFVNLNIKLDLLSIYKQIK